MVYLKASATTLLVIAPLACLCMIGGCSDEVAAVKPGASKERNATVTVATVSDEEIKQIAAVGKDDRSALLDELRIYPDARQYEIVATTTEPGSDPMTHKPLLASEKWVDGKYIVSRFRPPAVEQDIVLVVTFDRESQSYRKWSWTGEGPVSTQMGIRAPNSRTLAWFQIHDSRDEESDISAYSIETHTDTTTTWTEVTMKKDGTVLLRIDGIATKTK